MQIINNKTLHKFDLEERTLVFSKRIIDLVKNLSKDTINHELISQLIRSSGSIGANYREANDSLGKKDFYMRIKICRKEAKETQYWLELILYNNSYLKDKVDPLITEVVELIRIFSSILLKAMDLKV